MIEGYGVIIIGLALIGIPVYQLFFRLDKKDANSKIAVSVSSLKIASWLVVGGLFITTLGVLNILAVLPWWPK
jgi:hypothetical protein